MIDFNRTKQYTLSIRLSTDGFCFTVHNPQADNEYAFLPYTIDPTRSMTANLKLAVQENEMLRRIYATVNIIVAEAPYTIVPKEYYAESHERELYLQNFPQTTDNIVVQNNLVGDEQAVVLFGIEQQLHQYLTERYPKAEIYASISPLINYGVEKSYTATRNYNFVYQQRQRTDMLCFTNGSILFANTFCDRDINNITYFLLNCWQTLGLSQTEDILHLAGSSRNTKAQIRELQKFIKNIHIIRPAEEFHSTELARIGEMPFDLQTLIACE